MENWKFKSGETIKVTQKCAVPDSFSIIVRQVIRDSFPSKEKIPYLDRVYEKIRELRVEDVLHLNLCQGSDIPAGGSKAWV